MSPENREDMHLLYQVAVADLAFFKSQQWSITSSTLLVYSALFAASKVMGAFAPCPIKTVLVIAVLFVCLSSVVLLWKLQKAMGVRHSRLEFVRSHLTELFQRAWAAEDKGTEFLLAVYFLYVVVVAGGLLTALLVLWGVG